MIRVAAWLALLWLWATPSIAAPGCRAPVIDTVLDAPDRGWSIDNQTRDLFTSQGQRLQWVTVSWWSPPRGRVFVTDCQGARVAKLDLGLVKEARPGPRLGGRPTLEVVYVSGYGTGILGHSVALLQFRDNRIVTLWRHEARSAAAIIPVEANEGLAYHWRYLNGGHRIAVTGRRSRGRIVDMDRVVLRGRSWSLAPEAWCYRASATRFVACA